MHRRYAALNIPTEILRTAVTIAETGSYTKAAELLGLSQPGITAQVKKLQIIVGGELFERTAHGTRPTKRGDAVICYARRLLDVNDRIIGIGGGAVREVRRLRVGICSLFAEHLLAQRAAIDVLKAHATIVCDRSAELVRQFAEDYLDVVLAVEGSATNARATTRWSEPFVWVRARDFVLSPGAPIPLLGSVGCVNHAMAVDALERNNLSHHVVFSGIGLQAKLLVVAAGMGLMVLPQRCTPAELTVARDYYLPPIEPATVGLFVNRECDLPGIDAVSAALGFYMDPVASSSAPPPHAGRHKPRQASV